jgi:putative ABC transport system substrate-binding protein
MRRRDFITLLGGAAAVWPLAARGQQPAMPVIGVLRAAIADVNDKNLVALRQGLRDAGYLTGQNATIEYRWSENRYDRLPALAADLVGRRVAVIFAGSGVAAQAAKAATTTIPVVFAGGMDPVQVGLVASLNRPGGNVTGVTFFSNAIEPKRLGLLRDVVPRASVIAALINPDNASAGRQSEDLNEAVHAVGMMLNIAFARNAADLEPAFADFVKQAGGLVVATDAALTAYRNQIVALAARHALPAIYPVREFVEAGGLMSYGANGSDAYRQAGVYVGRILKGEKPADLPVMLPTKFELVINLKTAKSLGLTIPPGLLAIADEVIE